MADLQLFKALLGLANVNVVNYQLLNAERIEVGVESSLDAALCPTCQRVSTQIHDTAELQTLRELPIWGRQCWLRYAPRRFTCATCQATFVERVAWREPGFAHTVRYAEHIYERTRHQDLARIAQDEGLSQDTVRGIFERWAKKRWPSAATRA
jgi:transposase